MAILIMRAGRAYTPLAFVISHVGCSGPTAQLGRVAVKVDMTVTSRRPLAQLPREASGTHRVIRGTRSSRGLTADGVAYLA
jgi:hypothetical protein